MSKCADVYGPALRPAGPVSVRSHRLEIAVDLTWSRPDRTDR